jgi:hypothetical protein
MRRALATAGVVLTVAVFVAPAAAATPTERKLQAQIKVLQVQTKSLQAQVKTLKKQVTQARSIAVLSALYSGCATAATADALQGTWTTIDTHFGTSLFGAQTPVNDYDVCSKGLNITRVKTTATVSVLQALLTFLLGP